MSVTTTTNPVYSTVSQVLVDYDLHHSGSPDTPADASAAQLNPRSHEPEEPNPENWPVDHRRIPPYRPINRHLDMELRPAGGNNVEAMFVFVLLNGVGVHAAIAQTWRSTIHKWTRIDLKYKIGGEK